MSNDSNGQQTNDNVMEAIGSAMDGIGNSYSSIYSTLSNALEKNVQMTEQFSLMMEQTYLHHVHIVSELKPAGNGVIDLLLSIKNATQFPIVSLTGDIQVDHSKIETSVDEGSTLFEAPFNLKPHTTSTHIIHLNILQDKPIYGKGLISLSFPHPLYNKSIQLQHTFGIYIIDQLSKSSIDKSESNKLGKRLYRAKFIREILEIHAIKGLELGMCIKLSCENFTVVCELIRFSDDLQFIEIEFSSASESIEMKLVSRLIEEFNALNY